MSRKDVQTEDSFRIIEPLEVAARLLLNAKAKRLSPYHVHSMTVTVMMPDGTDVQLRVLLEEDWPAAHVSA